MKRYRVERTNKTEIRPEEQSEKTESRRENLWNDIQLKEASTTFSDGIYIREAVALSLPLGLMLVKAR